MNSNRLDQIIFRHYSKSALLPILTIELLLLILYFSISTYTNIQSEKMLREEVRSVMPHLARQQALRINQDFEHIARQTAYFAKAHEDLFEHPSSHIIPGEQPAFAIANTGGLYQTNLTNGSSLFFTNGKKLTSQQIEKAAKTAVLNPLYKHVVVDIQNVVASYFNTPDNMNRLYPFIPEVYNQYPADLNMEDYNFYYLADQKHNPSKGSVWTGVYLDPAGNGWMLSCIAPVYAKNKLEGVVGLDVTTQKMVNNLLNLDLPWKASAFIADKDGMILAMAPTIEEVLGLKELKSHVYNSAITQEQLKPEDYNLFNSSDKAIAKTFRWVYDSNQQEQEIKLGNKNVFLIQSKIVETGWRLFVIVQPENLFDSVQRISRLSKTIGFIVIGFMFSFYIAFFLFLRKRARLMAKTMSEPITSLANAVSLIGSKDEIIIQHSGIEEIDKLTDKFNTMVYELNDRNKQLIQNEVQIKMQKNDAELAFAQGMFESASGYLHNVGNSVTALNSNLMDLQEIAKSTEQYPAVFSKLRENNDPKIINRFEDILVNKTVPRLIASTQKILSIGESIHKTISHQQELFANTKSIHLPKEFNISDMLIQICEEQDPGEPTIQIKTFIEPEVKITHHRNLLYHGMSNIIKNAIEAISLSGIIEVYLRQNNEKIQIIVSDTGAGIDPAHLSKIFTAGFTTKKNGHGLGLHSFSVFLSANKGIIEVKSEGINKGAVFTIQIENLQVNIHE